MPLWKLLKTMSLSLDLSAYDETSHSENLLKRELCGLNACPTPFKLGGLTILGQSIFIQQQLCYHKHLSPNIVKLPS